MVKSTAIITLMTVLGIAIGFALQLLVAYFFGASAARDAYFAAIALPNYLSLLFSGSLGLTFLPEVIRKKKGRAEDFNQFVSNSITFFGLVLLVVSVMTALLARPLIGLVYSGFTTQEQALSARLLELLSPMILFQNLSFLLSNVYYSEEKFFVPALSQIVTASVGFISVLLLSRVAGIASLALGTVIGYLCFLIAELFLGRNLFKYEFELKIEKGIRDWVVLSIPLFVAGIFSRANVVVERMLASHMELGSISFLGYSNQILNLLSTIATQGLAITIFPSISKAWVEGRSDDLQGYLQNGLKFVLFATIPLVVLLYFWGLPLIQLVYLRGAFTTQDSVAVYHTVQVLIFALVFVGIGGVTAKVFYAVGATSQIAVISVLEIAVYVAGAVLLGKYLSYRGLALAYVLSTGVNIGLSLAYISRRFVRVRVGDLTRYTLLVLAFASGPLLLLGFVSNLAGLGSGGGDVIFLKVTVVLISYTLLFYFTKSKTTEPLIDMFRQLILSIK